MPKERTFHVCFKIKGEWLEKPLPFCGGTLLRKAALKQAVKEYLFCIPAKVSNIKVEEVK